VQIVTLPDGTTRRPVVPPTKFNEADLTGAEVTGMLSPRTSPGRSRQPAAGKPKS
jgi:hypothetical protein